jgi:hypothetical protein
MANSAAELTAVQANPAPVEASWCVLANSAGMLPQCPAWRGSGGDGRTGLTVTGMTDPAGLTSRRDPV